MYIQLLIYPWVIISNVFLSCSHLICKHKEIVLRGRAAAGLHLKLILACETQHSSVSVCPALKCFCWCDSGGALCSLTWVSLLFCYLQPWRPLTSPCPTAFWDMSLLWETDESSDWYRLSRTGENREKTHTCCMGKTGGMRYWIGYKSNSTSIDPDLSFKWRNSI